MCRTYPLFVVLSWATGAIGMEPLQEGLPQQAKIETALASIAEEFATDDPQRQRELLAEIRKHPSWKNEAADLIDQWCANADSIVANEARLIGMLRAFAHRSVVEEKVAAILSSEETDHDLRFQLFRIMAIGCRSRIPKSWEVLAAKELESPNADLQLQAFLILQNSDAKELTDRIQQLAIDRELPVRTRITAIHFLARHRNELNEEAFKFLLLQIQQNERPFSSIAAARVLGSCRLNEQQAILLCNALQKTSATLARLASPALYKVVGDEVGSALLSTLPKSPLFAQMSPQELEFVVEGRSREIQNKAQPLVQQLQARFATQNKHLRTIEASLPIGDAEVGERVYFSKKAACNDCHRMNDRGGGVGPNLSRVAFLRSKPELLRSLIFPSTLVAPEFRNWVAQTESGKVFSGMLVMEDAREIHLQTPTDGRVAIPVDEIEEMVISRQSIMPAGIEKTLSEKELADLLEFLSRRY